MSNHQLIRLAKGWCLALWTRLRTHRRLGGHAHLQRDNGLTSDGRY